MIIVKVVNKERKDVFGDIGYIFHGRSYSLIGYEETVEVMFIKSDTRQAFSKDEIYIAFGVEWKDIPKCDDSTCIGECMLAV